MNKDRCKGVGPIGDDLYAGMLKDFSKFLIKAKNTDEDIFLDF